MRVTVVFCLQILLGLAAAAPGASQGRAPSSSADWQLAALIECRDIIGVVQRLGCYDAALGGAGGLGERYKVRGPTSVAAREEPPLWQLQQDRDPFSELDRSLVRLMRHAAGGEMAGRGLDMVEIECDGRGGRRLSIGGSDYLGLPGQALALRFRAGAGGIVQEVWHVGSKGTTVVMPPEGSGFLDGVLAGQPTLVEVVSFRGQRFWARFPAAAMQGGALAYVLRGCRGGEASGGQGAERPISGPSGPADLQWADRLPAEIGPEN